MIHHVQPVILAERTCTPGRPFDEKADAEAWRMVAHPCATPANGDAEGRYACPLCGLVFVPTWPR